MLLPSANSDFHLAECDQRALERFQMLDHMEAEDESEGYGTSRTEPASQSR